MSLSSARLCGLCVNLSHVFRANENGPAPFVGAGPLCLGCKAAPVDSDYTARFKCSQ